MTLPITTERLILRRYTYHDIQDIIEFVSHPSVAKATPEIEATESGVRKYIDLQNSYQPFEQDKCFDLAIERKEDSKVIGLLTLVCREHKQGEIGYAETGYAEIGYAEIGYAEIGYAEIGYALGAKYRGQGYATEAARALMAYGFTSLDLHRIQADTGSDNSASWRVMERLGMRREKQLQEAIFKDGEWVDALIYGILADEWPAD